MMEIRTHKFVEPGGESHVFNLDELEEVIQSIWWSVAELPCQLVDEYDGTVVLRYARSMPKEIASDVFLDEVDLEQVVAFAVVAVYEETDWTLCWAMPIWLKDGPGELFYLGPDGVRLTPEDMRRIV